MLVFENEFVKISYDHKKKLLYIKRFPENTDDEYRETIYNIAANIQKYKPEKIIADMVGYDYPIGEAMQAWAVKTLGETSLNNNVKKIAFLMTEDFIAKLVLSDMIDNASNLGINVRYFSSREEVDKWFEED